MNIGFKEFILIALLQNSLILLVFLVKTPQKRGKK